MRILVADNDASWRLIVRTALRNLGHECNAVADGEQAWSAFQTQLPDVVISDGKMPGLAGPELCRKIREYEVSKYVYFIIVSGHGLLSEIVEGVTAGADDYLVKPLNPDDLQIRLIVATRMTALHNRLAAQHAELRELNHDLKAIARRDPLTRLGNRRALDEDLEFLEARVIRYRHRYCLALIDVDHFRSYNDAFGHQAGDRILQAVAAQLKAEARGGDAIYRYGGEEFLCVLPEQSIATGIQAVERMRHAIERLAVRQTGADGAFLTISGGVAVMDAEHPRPASAVIKEADEALYRAEELGRNRVEGQRPEESATDNAASVIASA
jgi:two-component system cell cycle response regulator